MRSTRLTRRPSRDDVAALKRDHPLTEVLPRCGIRLRRHGRGTYLASCPFHDDRHPSFLVYTHDQHYHCFGCGAHGDVYSFLMHRHGLTFPEAYDYLKGQPPLPTVRAAAPPDRAWRGRRGEQPTPDEQAVLDAACDFYQRRLWREPRLLAYLHARGLSDRTIAECGLGYADGRGLAPYLRRRCGTGLAEDLGLLVPPARAGSAAGPREFFAGRIVVPELRGGRCVWLIGRHLDDEPRRPKYLALPGPRPLLGHDRVAGRRAAFVCEGVFDWLTAVEWGLPACSPCGTHLPAERLGVLAGAARLCGVFDGDAAGRAAAARFAEEFAGRWRELQLPRGQDLNDLGRAPRGRARFFALLRAARGRERRHARRTSRCA